MSDSVDLNIFVYLFLKEKVKFGFPTNETKFAYFFR